MPGPGSIILLSPLEGVGLTRSGSLSLQTRQNVGQAKVRPLEGWVCLFLIISNVRATEKLEVRGQLLVLEVRSDTDVWQEYRKSAI